MPKLRRHIYLSAMVLLLSSCIYDEMQEGGQTVPSTTEEQRPVAPQQIQLSATLLDARTRAADGENEGNFALETPVTVSVDGNNYSYKTDATSASNPLDCQDAVPPYFPIDGSSVRIMAYYPSTMQYATTVRTFTVAHDQSQTAVGTANYKASDLMVGLPKADFADASSVSLIDGSDFGRKVKPTSLSIPLEFEHKMVKIRLNTTNNGATVRKVEMTGIKRSIDFNPSDTTFQNLALATGDTDAAANSIIMYEDATGSTSNVVCTALIPKQDLTSGTPFITVTTASGTPLVYKLPENYYFAPGKQYRFNVNINDYEITATSDVTDWDDDTSFNMGDGLAVRKNIKMNPLWYVAEGNMTGTNTMGGANNGYYYTWATAMANFAAQSTAYADYRTAGKSITGISDATWHMPVKGEWMSIVPKCSGVGSDFVSIFTLDSDANDLYQEENIIFGYSSETKSGITDKYYWKRINNNKGRAIRFLGSDYCSAWEYEMSSSPLALTVTSCLIDCVNDSKADASAAYDAIDWTNLSSRETALQRKFYALGFYDVGNSPTTSYYYGSVLGLWSTTYSISVGGSWGNGSWGLNYESTTGLMLYSNCRQSAGFNVRLFRDN